MTTPSINNSALQRSLWVVVPAAGVGARMKTDRPKQYLVLHPDDAGNGHSVIHQTLLTLSKVPCVKGIVVALGRDDGYWADEDLSDCLVPIKTVVGGVERHDSVLAGLDYIATEAADVELQDWVMVHDAARPCVRVSDIETLFNQVNSVDAREANVAGGLLGLPVTDTMKRISIAGDSVNVTETIDRQQLWRAFTPQMFRLDVLRDAIRSGVETGVSITDEASAIEHQGLQPVMVESHSDNIKITRPDDLALAAYYLASQNEAGQNEAGQNEAHNTILKQESSK